MVKADPKRDYYKDLELPTTADSEEIKKQFRLLGTLHLRWSDIHADPEQLNSITQTAIEGMKSSSSTSFRQFRMQMRS